MKRRAFLCGSGAMLVAPLAAQAQPAGKTYRIGVLTSSQATNNPALQSLERGLADLGYVEGRNIKIEWRGAAGRQEQLRPLAQELANLNADLLVGAGAPATIALRQAAPATPIIFLYTADPVALGLVSSLSRPGRNTTGISAQAGDYVAKSLELLKEVVPRASRVAVVCDPSVSSAFGVYLKELESAAKQLGLALQIVAVKRPEDFDTAFAGLSSSRTADAILIPAQPLTFSERNRIGVLAGKSHVPTMVGFRESVVAGGLLSYGTSITDVFRRGALYVHKILNGAKPADLPVEQPTTFELVINLKTAKALGVTIPQSLLLRADQVIE